MRDLLAARGEATVAELASDLAMNQANIRRHLDILRSEGLVDVTMRRHEIGRPSYVYRLTERAEEQSAHYPRLVNRMVRRIAALPEGGEALLSQVFAGVAEDIAGAYQPQVNGATVGERVMQTSDALKDEGIVDHWSRDDDGSYHLMNTTCPYRKAAELTDAPCHADHKTVELLVGAPVEQVSRMVDGHAMCEYVVHEIQTTAKAKSDSDRALGAL